MDTSPTTERTPPLNPRIDLEKYEHLHQVENLNLGGQVLPRGTQLTKLYLVHLVIQICNPRYISSHRGCNCWFCKLFGLSLFTWIRCVYLPWQNFIYIEESKAEKQTCFSWGEEEEEDQVSLEEEKIIANTIVLIGRLMCGHVDFFMTLRGEPRLRQICCP
jgi:hypothetical protein